MFKNDYLDRIYRIYRIQKKNQETAGGNDALTVRSLDAKKDYWTGFTGFARLKKTRKLRLE
jgi:hypothetical protein